MKTIILSIGVIIFFIFSCVEKKESGENAMETQLEAMRVNNELEAQIGKRARAIFQPLALEADNPENPITNAKVKLGKILYFDKRLSKDQTQSCNSCHDLNAYGCDNQATSDGDAGEFGTRNSPTVLNAALHTSQFWDGRAKNVEEQAGMPILNPVEMAIPSKQFLIDRLAQVELYQKMFKEAFPDEPNPLTYSNIQNAIGAFERTLITPSKFDDYLKGNVNAITVEEKKGLKTFIDAGCTTCHMGSLIGGNIMQKFGLYGNYWELTNSGLIDEGRFVHTGNEGEKYMFKVPSLRNVAETYPYFHDGSVDNIEEALRIIAKLNLNKDLTDEQVKELIAFLRTLTSELPDEVKQFPPELVSTL